MILLNTRATCNNHILNVLRLSVAFKILNDLRWLESTQSLYFGIIFEYTITIMLIIFFLKARLSFYETMIGVNIYNTSQLRITGFQNLKH